MADRAATVEYGRCPAARGGSARPFDDLAKVLLEGIPEAVLVTLQGYPPQNEQEGMHLWICVNLRGKGIGKTLEMDIQAVYYWQIVKVFGSAEVVERGAFSDLVRQAIITLNQEPADVKPPKRDRSHLRLIKGGLT